MNNSKWYKIIFESLSEKKGIQHFVEQLYLSFHVSIVVLDISGEIIASSVTDELKIARNRVYRVGDSISASDLKKERKGCVDNPEIVEDDGVYIINEPLMRKGGIVGYTIVFFYQREKAEEFILLNKILAQAAEVELGKQETFVYYGKTMKEQLYARMMFEGGRSANVDLEEELPCGYYLCELSELNTVDMQKAYKQLQEWTANHLIWVKDDDMYILFWGMKKKEEEALIREIKYLVDGRGRAAVSEYFSALKVCRAKKEILKRMFAVGAEEMLLEKEYYTKVIYSYAADVFGRDVHKNFQMYRLKDEERSTLKAYLKSGNHLKKTAASLHIHRNTLVYRLMKIQEILQVDINEVKVSQELLAELTIYEIYEEKISEKGK